MGFHVQQVPVVSEPIYWCAQAPSKPVAKPVKIAYPFLAECAAICEDAVTRHVLEKASMGSLPSGFALRKKPVLRISARVKKHVFSKIIPQDPQHAIEVIREFMRQHGVGDVDTDAVDTKKVVQKGSVYSRSISHRKQFRQSQLTMFAQRLGASFTTTKEREYLDFAIEVGFALQHLKCPHITIDHQKIVNIKKLVLDEESKHYTIQKKAARFKKQGKTKAPVKKKTASKKSQIDFNRLLSEIKEQHLATVKTVRRPEN